MKGDSYHHHQQQEITWCARGHWLWSALAVALTLASLQVVAGQQQQAPAGSRSSRQPAGASATPQVSPQPVASEPNPSVNLIPVDQPMRSGKAEPQEDVVESGDLGESVVVDEASSLAEGPIEVRQQAEAVDRKQQQQQVENMLTQAHQTPEQFKHLQQQQQMERRFGLFKKGQQQYGAPMSASYLASPYLSDCERCLASLGQQSGELQQLDPLPPAPVAPIAPPPQPQPAPAAQPFGPLKNKLFMKFPFFLKPVPFPDAGYGGGHSEAVPYWHQYQPLPTPRPAPVSSTLYLRPAYNCIQANPPQLGHHEIQQLSSSAGLKSPASKGYAHQQQSYSSSQY